MKMIYVGSLAIEPDRDSNWIAAFKVIGCMVIPFCSHPSANILGLSGRICRRFSIGDENRKMQNALLELADRERPDWIHFRLPIEFDRNTIEALKARNLIVTQYFNDDPFSKRAPFGLNWKFRRALTAYDAHFVYRAINISAYMNAGAKLVQHCPPTYDPKRHFLSDTPCVEGDFIADAAFIGHYEEDWRAECLEALATRGFSVILKGGGWNDAIRGLQIGKSGSVSHAYGAEYNYIYSNVVVGLCFFSKINNDSWTERALEIVAVGGVLVCERTSESEEYFKDKEEAYFFSSINELISIVAELKANPQRRELVRLAGYRRLISGSNTVLDRARKIYEFAVSLKENGLYNTANCNH